LRSVLSAQAVGAAGLAVAVIGTFLPWLRSGDVRRNSYASFGVLRRLIGFHGVADVMIRGWPLLGAVSAAVVLVAVAGLHRTAGVLALATAAWALVVSSAALAHDPAAGIRVDPLGPAVTLTGATAAAAAAILTLITQVRAGSGGNERDRAAGHAT
jgi:hypothetical protein